MARKDYFDGFHNTTCGFLSHPKAKITKFGDKQASKIRVRTKYFFIPSDVLGRPAWRPGHPSWNVWEPKELPEIFIRATNFEVWAP